MPDYDKIWDTLKNSVLDLAKSEVKDFTDDAIKDGEAFLAASKERLMRWTQLLIDKKITQDDFEFLVKGLKDLAQMDLLLQAGLTAIKVDKLKNGIIDIIIKTAISLM